MFGLRGAPPPVPVSIALGNPGSFVARPCPHPSPKHSRGSPSRERSRAEESPPWLEWQGPGSHLGSGRGGHGHGGTRVPRKHPSPPHKSTSFTFRVLQAEAGLVALRHLGAVEVQEVVVGEHLHAVVVPAARDSAWGSVPRATDRLAGGFPPGTRVERRGWWERRDEKGWLEERRTEADGGDRGNRAADCRRGRGAQRSAGPQCPHPLHGKDEAWRVGGAVGISEEDGEHRTCHTVNSAN